MTRRRQRREIFECPHCGADVAVGSKVCRECGSDDVTGWQSSEEVDYQSLELPEGWARDPAHGGGVLSERRPWWVVATALLLAAVLVWLAVGGFFW